MNRRIVPLLCAALTIAAAGPLSAQLEVGVRGSTLGAGLEGVWRLAPRVALRVTGNSLGLTRNEEVEGITYELRPRLRSLGAGLDLYPFGRTLYLTGGFLANNNTAVADALIDGTITVGNQTYTSAEIQALRGTLEWERGTVPYAGFGFVTGGRIGFGFEAGVVFSGTPTVSLTGETTMTGAERQAFDAAVAQEEAEVRAWIDDHRRWTRYYPLLAVGLRIRL